MEVHLISERAEAGLIGELPGLITNPLSNTCLLYTSDAADEGLV